jgi:hypothetical protein
MADGESAQSDQLEQTGLDLEEMAATIRVISDAADKMMRAGLTERAIVLLVQDAAPGRKLNKDDIRRILRTLPRLAEEFLCPDPFHTPEDTSRVEEDEPIDLTTPVRTRARLAAWREVEGDISGYDSEGYQRMIDHWPVVDDPERLGEVDEGESRVETTSGIDAGPWQEHEGTRVAQAVIAEIDKAYARGYNDGVQW